jgi:hypothetical protein
MESVKTDNTVKDDHADWYDDSDNWADDDAKEVPDKPDTYGPFNADW